MKRPFVGPFNEMLSFIPESRPLSGGLPSDPCSQSGAAAGPVGMPGLEWALACTWSGEFLEVVLWNDLSPNTSFGLGTRRGAPRRPLAVVVLVENTTDARGNLSSRTMDTSIYGGMCSVFYSFHLQKRGLQRAISRCTHPRKPQGLQVEPHRSARQGRPCGCVRFPDPPLQPTREGRCRHPGEYFLDQPPFGPSSRPPT